MTTGQEHQSGPLASADWLDENLGDENLRLIDMRGAVLPPSEPPPHYIADRDAYLQAHIPGAQYVDWLVDIVEPGSPSNDVASPRRFAELMSRLGVDQRMHVVIYDDAANLFAARLRWCLRYYGHESVSLLDGGWQSWLAGGYPVEAGAPTVPRREFVPRINQRMRATGDDILALIERGDMQLLDTRSPAEYAGDSSRAARGGHIPGAINLPRGSLLAADDKLKSAAELKAQLETLGVDLDAADTVLYCNSGVSATYGMLALEVAGGRNLRVYDGSWKEWGADPSKPIATPD